MPAPDKKALLNWAENYVHLWNEGDLDSYLIEISRDILGFKDEDGEPLVEKILDTLPEGCGECGTKAWVCEDGAKVTCSEGGAEAEYANGDDLTQAWIHEVKSTYFPDA